MKYLTAGEAIKKGSGSAMIRGWCYRIRKSNVKIFIILRDNTNIIQCLVDKEKVSNKVWEDAEKITVETSLTLDGTLSKDKRAVTGCELHIKDLEIVHLAERFPITRDKSQEFLLDKRHLWVRSARLTNVMKVRSTVLNAFSDFFRKNGYYRFSPPILTPLACEGGATLFKVKYFNDTTYLTQSWQLYAEAAIFGLEKIYCISPCFRAERSKTPRHLAEFWMAEVETAWQSFDELLKQAEGVVAHVVKEVVKNNSKELKELGQDINKLKKIKTPFPRMTYDEALKLLEEEGVKIPWGKDLRTIEEDVLSKHFSKPIIVTNYPKETMAFYKPRDPKNPKTALCFDMIAPEGYGEIIGGSQRDTDIDEMKKTLVKGGEKVKDYEWYFDTRRFGSVPHSGFGLGIERTVAWLCKLDNIKDAIPFPRTMLRKGP